MGAVGYLAEMARMFTKIFPPVLVFTLLFWASPLLAPPSSAASDPIEWKTFSVPNLGTRVDYPARIFSVPKGEPEVGIGQRFSTADGRAQLSIYSRPNEGGETPSTYLQHKLRYPRSAIQYQRVTRSFFAISTETDGTVYYSRCNFSSNAGGAIHCFDLMYPQTEKRAWDGVVTRISRSLRPL
jgi:hypothetical protein